MRESLMSFNELTKQLWQITKLPKDQLQDEHYDAITNYLVRREELLEDIAPPFTAEEKQLGASILELNKTIDQQLVIIKRELAVKIKNIKKTEQSQKSYLGYAQSATNGYFYDRKN